MSLKRDRKKSGRQQDPDILTDKEKRFAEEYVKNYNIRNAWKVAGYTAKNDSTMFSNAYEVMQRERVHLYIKELQKDIEKSLNISKARVLHSHMQIAYTSIANLHKTWITRKAFEDLTEDEKMAIAEIDTKIVKVKDKRGKETGVTEEYVKIKLFDRQKALDSIARMVGYDEPSELDKNVNKLIIANMFPFAKQGEAPPPSAPPNLEKKS